MAREIKFRVATKFCGDPFLGDVLELNLSEGTGTCYIWLHSYGGEEQDFDLNCGDKLMQYTGLTDKNGTEIYEGDVVQCALGAKYKVVFSDEWRAFMLIENKTGRQVIIYPEMKLEVIGNIYENPELID